MGRGSTNGEMEQTMWAILLMGLSMVKANGKKEKPVPSQAMKANTNEIKNTVMAFFTGQAATSTKAISKMTSATAVAS